MVNQKHLFVTPGVRDWYSRRGSRDFSFNREEGVENGRVEEGRPTTFNWSMLPIYLVARFSTLPQNWEFISGQTDPSAST